MLILNAEVSAGSLRDIRLADGTISDVAERLTPRAGEEVIDAGRCAVLPGLHDHHIHLRAEAAASQSVNLAGVTDAAEMRSRLHDAQQALRPGQWLRVIGYHESIAGDLDRVALDQLTTREAPLRVQHRTGIVWVLNTAGLAAAGLGETTEAGVDATTGKVWRRDDLIGRISALDPIGLGRVGSDAAALGVTGFTDATPGDGPSHAHDLARDLRAAGVTQRLLLMGPVGANAPDVARAVLGPVKVLLDDHDLPPHPELVDTIRAAHTEPRAVAIHCVTRVQLVLAITALESAGSRDGDRIEHGSVIPAELIPTVARLGVTVVTQPHFIAERGDDYQREVDAADIDSLYRVRSLQHAGIPVAAGSDAPFGNLDPWASIAAAIERRTPTGHLMGGDERVDLASALRLYLGHATEPARPRTVAPGEPAELCILRVPWQELSDAVVDHPIAATIIDGALASPPASSLIDPPHLPE